MQWEVRDGPNGWPGIFIPGDNALGFAHDCENIADSLESEHPLPIASVISWLRAKAECLKVCQVDQDYRERGQSDPA